MGKYVTTDSNHLPTGFYDSAIPGTVIPGGAHAITNAQYDALISAPATTTFSGGSLGSYSPGAVTPSPTQNAQAALVAGVVITCTSHSGVNGTYGLDGGTMGMGQELVMLINANSGAFPASASSWQWPDITGTLHTIPSAAIFLELWNALALFRLECQAIIWANSGSVPTNAVTIA